MRSAVAYLVTLGALIACTDAERPKGDGAAGLAGRGGDEPMGVGATPGSAGTAGAPFGQAGTTSSGGAPSTGGSGSPGDGSTAGNAASGNTSTGGSANGGTSAAGAAGAPGGTAGTVGTAGESGGGAGAPTDESAELYDPEHVPRFDIELPPDSVASLMNDPGTYVTGTLRYGTETVSNIGVRIKGEGSSRPLTAKAALKLKFDEFVDGQSFRGLRRLTLNNMVEDPSFLAERLAYHVFRLANLPAPRCNSALVSVNGEAYGLYANVEAEDKTFLRRWFASDDGNLYEEGQVDFVPGAETQFDLETNEKENDRTDLATLIQLVSTATPENFMEHVGQKLDMEHFLRFTAAEAAVNQWDMYAYTVFWPNNFRIYHDPTTRRFVLLPWGMDLSMKPYRDSGKPFIGVFSLARQYDRPNGRVTAGLLFQRCLESAPCKTALSHALEEIASVYENAGLEQLAERYREQIEPHVRADPRKEYSMDQFERGYQSLLSTIRGRVAAIRAEL